MAACVREHGVKERCGESLSVLMVVRNSTGSTRIVGSSGVLGSGGRVG